MKFHKGWRRLAFVLYGIWCVVLSSVWFLNNWWRVDSRLEDRANAVQKAVSWRQRNAEVLAERVRAFAAPYLTRAEMEQLLQDLESPTSASDTETLTSDWRERRRIVESRLALLPPTTRATVLYNGYRYSDPNPGATVAKAEDHAMSVIRIHIDIAQDHLMREMRWFFLHWLALLIAPLVTAPLAFAVTVMPVRWVVAGFRASGGKHT